MQMGLREKVIYIFPGQRDPMMVSIFNVAVKLFHSWFHVIEEFPEQSLNVSRFTALSKMTVLLVLSDRNLWKNCEYEAISSYLNGSSTSTRDIHLEISVDTGRSTGQDMMEALQSIGQLFHTEGASAFLCSSCFHLLLIGYPDCEQLLNRK